MNLEEDVDGTVGAGGHVPIIRLIDYNWKVDCTCGWFAHSTFFTLYMCRHMFAEHILSVFVPDDWEVEIR